MRTNRTEAAGAEAAPAETLGRRLLRGTVGGIIAGLVFIGVTMWFANSMPEGNPGNPLRLISSIVLGENAVMDGSADLTTGWIVHLVLSALFGVIFALAAPLSRTNGTIALAGGLYGLLLYLVNIVLIPELWLQQFQAVNDPFELAIHLVFGHLLAVFFYSSGTRRLEPFVAIGSSRASRT